MPRCRLGMGTAGDSGPTAVLTGCAVPTAVRFVRTTGGTDNEETGFPQTAPRLLWARKLWCASKAWVPDNSPWQAQQRLPDEGLRAFQSRRGVPQHEPDAAVRQKRSLKLYDGRVRGPERAEGRGPLTLSITKQQCTCELVMRTTRGHETVDCVSTGNGSLGGSIGLE